MSITHFASCATALVISSTSVHAQFAAGYTLTDLGLGHAPTETGGTPSINNAGQVVLSLFSAPARVWQNGVFTTLTNGTNATAAFINNSGQVAGAGADTFIPLGWFGPGGSGPRTTIAPSSEQGIVVGLNDAGDVALTSSTLGGRVYHSSTGTFSITGLSNASGIDNAGRVFGNVLSDGARRAAVSVNGIATLLAGNYPGSVAIAGNSAGFIIGYRHPGGIPQAFPLLWSPDGTATQLPMPAGVEITERVVPASINEAGLIVGYMQGPNRSAYAWYQGTSIDLNTRLTSAPGLPIAGWQLVAANDVNDQGQIVGVALFGGVEHVVLLNPVPAPGGVALLTLGGFAVVHRRRR